MGHNLIEKGVNHYFQCGTTVLNIALLIASSETNGRWYDSFFYLDPRKVIVWYKVSLKSSNLQEASVLNGGCKIYTCSFGIALQVDLKHGAINQTLFLLGEETGIVQTADTLKLSR